MSPNRRIFLNIIATYRRSLYTLALVMLSVCVNAADKEAPPAWRNCIDKAAAEEAMQAYTSNVIRCYWAGEDERVANLMPANLTFQFAVIGDSDVTNRVQKVLTEVIDSMRPDLRKSLEERGLINPTLQWLVRLCQPGVTNWQEYIKPQNQPAAFKESDFDAKMLKYFASRLKPGSIPLPAKVSFQYADQMAPLGKAEPGVDYSDVLPEETFILPFGCAIVPRAPERRRKIRLSATCWPYGKAIGYVWQVQQGAAISPWSLNGYNTPRNGFADIYYDVIFCKPRIDIIVFAKFGDDLYGAPTIISIYRPPYDRRLYGPKGVESIAYVNTSPNILYDISSIWIPHEWKDVFERNSGGQTVTFERTFPGCVKGEVFSATGEFVHELSPSGYPLITSKVEYFICSDTGWLKYRLIGEKIRYRSGECPYRRSGE